MEHPEKFIEQTHQIPVTHWVRKERLLFNPQSLTDLKWPNTVDKKSHVDSQVGKQGCKTLTSRTSSGGQNNSISRLVVKHRHSVR